MESQELNQIRVPAPAPSNEGAPKPNLGEVVGKAAETNIPRPEVGPTLKQPPQATPPSQSLNQPMTAAQPVDTPARPHSVIVADDVDVIEKHWVNIAKKVLNDNNNDPYKKAEAVIGLKTDYLEKRFGFKTPKGKG